VAVVLPAFREQLWRSLDAIDELARQAPSVPVFLSGWGSDPDYLDAIGRPLDHPRLALARGEPEETLVDGLELLLRQASNSGSTGLIFPREPLAALGFALPAPGGGWQQTGRFRWVEELGSLPSVYGLGAMSPAELEGTALIEVARGCRFRCGFCLSCNFPVQGVRSFPLAKIAEEIGHAARAGASALALLCSALNYEVEVLEGIVDAVDATQCDLEIESTIHASLLDPRRLALIERLRWRRMIVGLQSVNPTATESMGRNVDPLRFRAAIECLAAFHEPVVEIILGLPGDSLEGFMATLKFVLSLPAEVEIYHLRLDPGSRFFVEREAMGLKADFAQMGRVVSTPTFPARELERARLTLERLASRPWKHRARSLGLDFRTLYAR
jgi:radical SAM superfamily enzyme YgiQ (UPF0313 family)